MSSSSISRRLRVTNRLEELRAKYGHEDTWAEADGWRKELAETYEERMADILGAPGAGPGNVDSAAPSTAASLPGEVEGLPTRGVMPPAEPGPSSNQADEGFAF